MVVCVTARVGASVQAHKIKEATQASDSEVHTNTHTLTLTLIHDQTQRHVDHITNAIPLTLTKHTQETPDFSLMMSGERVRLRYRTTQWESVRGTGWRTVTVVRAGHVSETEYGRGNRDTSAVGWWVMCPPHPVCKFFLRSRILAVSRY